MTVIRAGAETAFALVGTVLLIQLALVLWQLRRSRRGPFFAPTPRFRLKHPPKPFVLADAQCRASEGNSAPAINREEFQ